MQEYPFPLSIPTANLDPNQNTASNQVYTVCHSADQTHLHSIFIYIYTVEPRYLELAYFELPLILK